MTEFSNYTFESIYNKTKNSLWFIYYDGKAMSELDSKITIDSLD